MVGAPLERDVAVDVAGDRLHHPEPAMVILEHSALLDVQLDPADQVVEDMSAFAPQGRLVAGLLGVLPERAPVVDGADARTQILLIDALRDDAAAQHHLAEP